MLHPAIESLLFLKLTRNSVCESIRESDVEEKEDLINYIQNEASDYEIMHLVTIGDMPESKFDDVLEQEVWQEFRKDMVKSYDFFAIEEGFNSEDIDNLIFEMGPVSEMGLSSAKPIMELHQHNGTLQSISEEVPVSDTQFGTYPEWQKRRKAKAAKAKASKKLAKGLTTPGQSRADAIKGLAKTKAGQVKDAAIKAKNKGMNTWSGMTPKQQMGAKGVAGAAAVAGGAYLAYKAIKALKAKFGKADSAEAKAKIKAKIAKLKAKMKG